MRTTLAIACCLLAAATGSAARGEASAPQHAGSPAPVTAARPTEDGIRWFRGPPDAAFARAKAENKPVLLYWTAVWCPPCHELKAHVFSRPDVIAKSRAFVPVYLDGDDEGAQKLGERFHVLGYPTAIVLRPDGTELTRVGGGMDLEAYAEALDVALAEQRPVSAIVASLDGASALTREDCRRLAWHGWASEVKEEPAQRSRTLERAAQLCPADATVERARLEILAAQQAAASEADALKGGAAPTPRTAALVARAGTLMQQREIAPRIADVLMFPGEPYFVAARRIAGADADRLRAEWIAAMMDASRNPGLSAGLQVVAAGSAIRGAKLLSDAPLPPALVADVRRKVEQALAANPTGYAHAGVVNAAHGVYDVLGDRAAIRALLEHEIRTSPNPHYYLSDLADLEEEEGRPAEALRLFQQAYESAKGPASRFQWGVLYVQALLRLAPDDTDRIARATSAVLAELDGPDRLYTRSRTRLERLDADLRTWGTTGSRAAVLAKLRAQLAPICPRYPDADPARKACDAFVAST